MKILNIRIGFATNSSSNHSLVHLPLNKLTDVVDDLPDPSGLESYFGRGRFTLKSPEAKADYLGVILHNSLIDTGIPESFHRAIIRDWMPKFFKTAPEPEEWGGIDHQSSITVPEDFYEKKPDHQFFDELYKMIMAENLVV